MQSQQFDQSPQKPKQDKATFREMFQSSVADAKRIMGSLNTQTGSRQRAKVDGALLGGVCIGLLVAFLNIQHIDAPLSTSIAAFAIAIPLLVMGFLLPSGVSSDVPGWRLLAALVIGAWVAEGLGQLAVVVGVGAILAHFSALALILYIAAIAFALVFVPILSFIGLMVYAITQYKKNPPEPAKKPESL